VRLPPTFEIDMSDDLRTSFANTESGSWLSQQQEWAYAILRIAVGSLFGADGIRDILDYAQLVSPVGGYLSLAGGIMLTLGYRTSLAALILCGGTVVSYARYWDNPGFLPILNHGELQFTLIFVCFFIACRGGGVWSLDSRSARA
jgi:uncharacterized membrane protein YphA (DoxX/SURF4 family)